MTQRQANYNSHFLLAPSPSLAKRHPNTTAAFPKLNSRDRGNLLLCRVATAAHSESSASGSAVLSRILSTCFPSVVLRRCVREFPMQSVSGGSVTGTRKSDGQVLPTTAPVELPEQKQEQRPDRNVRRINGARVHFRDLAIMAFPKKTDANLAFFARVDVRTARRWLADDSEPPADVLGIVLCEIMRRFNQRS